MRIDTGQHMQMDQRMKLAPRMIQSMEILQMPLQALEERIEQELASNPTLELREVTPDKEAIREELEQTRRDEREGERELSVNDEPAGNNTDDFERLSNLSEQYGDTWESNQYETGESYASSRIRRDTGERDAKMDAMANTAARSASLNDQLLDQWRLAENEPTIQTAGEFLIGLIDADGYLRTELSSLAAQAPPGIDIDDIEAALDRLQQTLEPTGIGARDLRECLLLQIDAREAQPDGPDLAVARVLVEDHLKDIEVNRLPKIAEETGLDIEEVKAGIRGLRQFHPHPGRLLADEIQHTITPDAIVEFDEEQDRYVAILSHERIPSVTINHDYEELMANKEVDKSTRDFVGNNLRSARWLIDAIRQRHHTLLRVIYKVLDHQRDWFDQGPHALKPLPMTQLAEELGIHVATVSRAVADKYLQTPRGIVPLRMFFSGGTETESGESMSWTAVQAKLEELINGEDKSKPLSDDALVDVLKKEGIDIARRTVAKYRKQLNIPTARQRKEY